MTTIESQEDLAELMRTTGKSFVFMPVVTQGEDGTWSARYPGADWQVSGPDEAGARQQLHDAQLDRMRDPAHGDWQLVAVREYLARGPIPGVYELDPETSARIHTAPREGELEKVVAEIDRHRAG